MTPNRLIESTVTVVGQAQGARGAYYRIELANSDKFNYFGNKPPELGKAYTFEFKRSADDKYWNLENFKPVDTVPQPAPQPALIVGSAVPIQTAPQLHPPVTSDAEKERQVNIIKQTCLKCAANITSALMQSNGMHKETVRDAVDGTLYMATMFEMWVRTGARPRQAKTDSVAPDGARRTPEGVDTTTTKPAPVSQPPDAA